MFLPLRMQVIFLTVLNKVSPDDEGTRVPLLQGEAKRAVTVQPGGFLLFVVVVALFCFLFSFSLPFLKSDLSEA